MSVKRLTGLAGVVVPALAVALTLGSTPAAGAPSVGTPAAAVPTLSTSTVRDGLVVPWDLDVLPDGRMVVTERPGRIRVLSDGEPGADVVATVQVPGVRSEGEAGVLGIAVDTDFAAFPHVYVCASRDYPGSGGWVNEVLRYRVGSTWSAPTVLLSGMRANTTHNGCAVQMDADGLLWVTMGDAGSKPLAQDRSSLNGKVLRMTRSGGVPADNPVIGGTRDLVYTMGHRNPQGLAFRPGSDQVYEVEHGPNRDDEINLLRPGGNYGWPCYTGVDAPDTPAVCGTDGPDDYLPPAWASGSRTIATSGMTFARGAQWGDHEGDLFVTVLKDQELRRFDVAADGSLGTPETLYEGTFGRLRGAVSGAGGRLYLTTSNGNDRVVRVSPSTTGQDRIGGADRYAVAAHVSEAEYPDGATDVVVATGLRFPDALTGSAVGGNEGMPVLLTAVGSLPDATRTELRRLAPERIWVLGGSASVSDAVEETLDGLATEGATRIGGPDRYAVAAGVSARWYERGAPAVFVANGTQFADALSAGPAAAHEDAPLLLVSDTGVPASTAEELKRLAPERVYLLGGTGSIPDGVVRQLTPFASAPRERLGGRDRYAVARSVADRFWTTSDVVVASGETFSDGLTGGAAAGHRGDPLLLARSSSVPADTGQAMVSLAPTSTTILGGMATLDGSVATALGRLGGIP